MNANKNIFSYFKKKSLQTTKRFADDHVVPKPVKFSSLFRFSTACERISLIIGTTFAVIAGAIGVPAINLVYAEFTNVLIDRQYPTAIPSTKTIILNWFGGGEILVNASKWERMEALDNDAVAFAVSVVVFSGGALIFLGMSIFIFSFVALTQVRRISKLMFRSVLSQGRGWFDTKGHINFTSKISQDLTHIQNGTGERLSIFIYQTSVTVFILATGFFAGWLLTLVLLGCLVPMLIVFILLHKIQSDITASEVVSMESASQVAEEAFSGIRTVVAFGGEEKEVERYSEKLLVLQSLGVTKGMAAGFGFGFVWLVIYCCYAVAFSFGFRLILWRNEYTPAVLITVFFAVLTAATNLSYSLPYWESFAAACGSAGSIIDIIDTKSEINPFSNDGISGGDCNGGVEFKNVHFHYPSRPDVEVLNGLNLKINPGEKIGLVGESGSGKSTILDLIQRFYDPAVGEVYLDGVNLKSLNVSWLRRQISSVPQEPVLFSTTIGKNIGYGLGEAREDQIIQAAVKANIHEFISGLDNGYNTVVGGKEANLSGGEKQRIVVARAIIRTPKILLLDEVTSTLDQGSDAFIRKTLDEASRGRTTIIITHNIATLSSVDRIVVLVDGVVAEEGRHEALLKQNGVYTRLLKTEFDNIKKVGSRQNAAKSYGEELGRTYVEEGVKLVPGARGYFADFGISSWQELKIAKKVRDDRYLKVSCWQFLNWNKSHWPFLYFGLLSSVILGCIFPAVCVLYSELIGLLGSLEKETTFKVDIFSLILVLMGVLAGLLGFIQMCFLSTASIRLNAYLRLRTFETILHQEMAWFDSVRNSVSSLCSRLDDDCSSVQGVVGGRVGIIIQGFTAMLIGIALSLYISWKLALVTCVVMPLIFSGIFLDFLSSSTQRKKDMEAAEDGRKVALEAIHNIKVVNSLGLESLFLDRYVQLLKRHRTSRHLMNSFLRGFAYSIAQTTSFFGYAISLWYGAHLMNEENLRCEDIIRVSELIIYGCWVLGQALAVAPNFRKASEAAGRLQYLFYRRSKIRSGTATVPPFRRSSGEIIEFSNVYFSYPTRPDSIILRNINLSIRQGESVAIVGPSGSGKSTIIHLLLRFYDPNVGTVSIGHTKLPSFNLSTLRRSMALVSQDSVIFNRTVYENIAYGNAGKDIKLDDVIVAAKAANIHSFISSLPLGYNTHLGSTFASRLSGGQKQKIAIARALIGNPKILLLDEATSALDPESERSIQETLNKAMSGRTTITIGHRLGAIANADVIYVIVDGKIVESGSHSKLMRDKGYYYAMREGGN